MLLSYGALQTTDIFEQMKRECAQLNPAAPPPPPTATVKEFVVVKQTLEFAGESITCVSRAGLVSSFHARVEKQVAAETLQSAKQKVRLSFPAQTSSLGL